MTDQVPVSLSADRHLKITGMETILSTRIGILFPIDMGWGPHRRTMLIMVMYCLNTTAPNAFEHTSSLVNLSDVVAVHFRKP